MEDLIKKAILSRIPKKKSLKESICRIESEISASEAIGNTKKAKALKLVLERLKRDFKK